MFIEGKKTKCIQKQKQNYARLFLFLGWPADRTWCHWKCVHSFYSTGLVGWYKSKPFWRPGLHPFSRAAASQMHVNNHLRNLWGKKIPERLWQQQQHSFSVFWILYKETNWTTKPKTYGHLKLRDKISPRIPNKGFGQTTNSHKMPTRKGHLGRRKRRKWWEWYPTT